MNEQLEATLIKLLDKYLDLARQGVQTPHDFASLRETIVTIELEREIRALWAMLNMGEFEEQFKIRCAWRAVTPEQCISFDQMPESNTNKLYWDIACLVFGPATMEEILPIVLGNDELIHLSVSFSDHLSKEALSVKANERYKFLELVLKEVDHLNDLTETPTIEALTHYVLCQGMIFNVAEIANYPLHFHAKLQHQLNTKYPALANTLYSHNEALHTLDCDILLLNNNGITPKAALEQFIQGLVLGGTRMTGTEYASTSSDEAFKRFFAYFNALSLEMQEQLKALEGDTKNLGSIIDVDLATGQCVETTADYLKQIIEKNTHHPLLNSPPEMTSDELQQLERNYKYSRGKTILNSKKESLLGFELPASLTQKAIKRIAPENIDKLIDLLLSFPPTLYNTFWEHVTLINAEEDLEELANSMEFFNQEQRQALAEAMVIHYERFGLRESILFWAIKTNDLDIIYEVLKSIPNNNILAQRLAAVKMPDDYGWTILHHAADDPELLEVILELLRKDQRLAAIQVLAENIKGTTVLHLAVNNLESFETILALLPKKDRLPALQLADEDGNTLLHQAAGNPKFFKALLELLPVNDKLTALRLTDKNGDTVLHQAAGNPKFLKAILGLLLENQRLIALEVTDRDGVPVLYHAAENPQSLKAILGLLPELQRLNWLRTIIPPQSILTRLAHLNISSSEEGFKDSFAPDFIKISIFLAGKVKEEQYMNSRLFISNKHVTTLMASIKKCDTFGQVKYYLSQYVSNHSQSSLSKELLTLLGQPNIRALIQQWNRPMFPPSRSCKVRF